MQLLLMADRVNKLKKEISKKEIFHSNLEYEPITRRGCDEKFTNMD